LDPFMLVEKIYKSKWIEMTHLQKALGMDTLMTACILRY
jgi:hypothetical protein